MDWMYQGVSGMVEREEYLTGRKIDKTFEIIEKEENPNAMRNEEDCALINQLASHNFIDNLSKNDFTAKMREDPLFAIKMKQQEQRKEILQNPVKLKHLQEILKTSLKKDKKHKKDKKKSKKKQKSRKERKSSSRSRSRSPVRRKRYSSNDSCADDSDHVSSKYRRRTDHHSHKDTKAHRSEDRHKVNSASEVSSSNRHTHNHRPSHYSQPHRPTTASGNERNKPVETRKSRPKLSEEEIRKRREEMMSNAAWREKDRSDTVRKLNERETAEEQQLKGNSSSGAKFIKPMLTSIAGTTSIEDSIRQKKFTSQRGPGSMDSNFARR